jgi:hypothetical protein
MDIKTKTIIVILLASAAMVGLCLMVSSTLQTDDPIEPCGPMTGGDCTPPTLAGTEVILWDEMIYVPTYPECVGENRVHVDGPIKIEFENGTTAWHQMYTCQKAEMNRTNIRVDATRLPDYELPE